MSVENFLKKAFEKQDFQFYPPEGLRRSVTVVAQEDLVLSGKEILESALNLFDEKAQWEWHFDEGQLVLKDQAFCLIEVDWALALKLEKVVCYFLSQLCGMATRLRCFVNQTELSSKKVLSSCLNLLPYDLEKKAIEHGGAEIRDHFLIDSHFMKYYSGLRNAVEVLRRKTEVPEIFVEVVNLEEAHEAMDAKVDGLRLKPKLFYALKDVFSKSLLIDVNVGASLEQAKALCREDKVYALSPLCEFPISHLRFCFENFEKEVFETYL